MMQDLYAIADRINRNNSRIDSSVDRPRVIFFVSSLEDSIRGLSFCPRSIEVRCAESGRFSGFKGSVAIKGDETEADCNSATGIVWEHCESRWWNWLL